MMDHINVKGQGDTFAAYLARPKILPASAVVVLQELFGVNADIRRHCDELAEQGSSRSPQICTGGRSRAST
jgi:carboxymethylenebutenolidase